MADSQGNTIGRSDDDSLPTTTSETPQTQPRKNGKVSIARVAGASLIGTTIEFFDFFIFGTAAALIFNRLFFPDFSPLAGTLASFATFGVAFIARPLGAMIFGHFGDRMSRKSMLVLSLVLMGVGTLAVGLLPTYDQIGILAPILLVICRLFQGLALGGEWGGAVLMAAEHAPPGKRAFYASWPQVGVPFGLVLATGTFFLVQSLPDEQLDSWGWRIPFIISAALVLVGLYIRLKIEESPALLAIKKEDKSEKYPAAVVFKQAGGRVILGAFAVAASNIPFYMATVFALTYGAADGVDRDMVLGAVCIASVVQMATIPLASSLCDRFGRRPIILIGCVFTALVAFPFFWLLDTHNMFAIIVALLLVLPLCHALTYGPQAAFIPELFPTQLRYSGAGIAYTLGGVLFSAPVPFVCAALLDGVGAAWPLSLYIVGGAVLTAIAVFVSRESQHDEIAWTSAAGRQRHTDPVV